MKTLLITCFLGIALCINAQISRNGLVAYFPFNGNTDDSSGNGRHGVNHNARLVNDRFGRPNAAYQFNGDDYIVFSGKHVQNAQYTYSLWAKINTIPFQGEMAFALNIGSSGGDQSLNISNNYFNGQTTYRGWLGGGYNSSSQGFGMQENKALNPGIWTHVLSVRESNHVRLYVNGVMVDSLGSIFNVLPYYGKDTVNGYIGIRNNLTGGFRGVIDDVAIYNRALSKKEINDIYWGNPSTVASVPFREDFFTIYPNPAGQGQIVQIRYNTYSKPILSLDVFNINGQLQDVILNQSADGLLQFSHNLDSGIYLIKLVTEEGEVFVKKWIVE